MDPLTQGVAGAVLAQSSRPKTSRQHVILAALFGWIAGMLPDLDVLIRSEADPLLFLEYHRQFTHSFAFIPVGAAISAMVLHVVLGRRWSLSLPQTFLFCALGFASHGILDAMTSYGTMLLWPFDDTRFAFRIVSVVDPLITLPALILLITACIARRSLFARIAFIWVLTYLSFGAAQHLSAREMAVSLATDRGHSPTRIEVKPSFANTILWKSVYEADGKFYVDAVRPRLGARVFEGASIPILNTPRDLPWLDPMSQQARDIERFAFFSDGYLAEDPNVPNRIIDVRYSFVPNELAALWSIELAPDAPSDQHARYATHREDARARFADLWTMMWAE